jgi:hypothetical protein
MNRIISYQHPCCESSVILFELLVTANVVPSSPIIVTLMKKALSSSETRFLQEPHGVTSQKTAFFSEERCLLGYDHSVQFLQNRRFREAYRLHLQSEILWVSLVCSEDVPHGGRGWTSCNGISIVACICYHGDIVDNPLLCRMWWLGSHGGQTRLEWHACVEAGYNTSTIALRVVRGDEKRTQFQMRQ